MTGRATEHTSSLTRPRHVVLLQTAVPAYRQPVIDELDRELEGTLSLYCGSEGFERTVVLDVEHARFRLLRNHFLLGRRLLWQSGGLRGLLRADVVVMELNPRIVSSWFVLIARRLLGRRSILWGHAWPRLGPSSRSEPLRNTMRRLADAIVVYTESQSRELARVMPSASIAAAPNALYSRAEHPFRAPTSPARDIVFSGRLIDAKKPMLLVDAFLAVRDSLPADARLVVMGDGPLREALERRASTAGDQVVFEGTVTDYDSLERIHGRALCSVSPGYVGLSLVQSLWFGVPCVIARDEPHSPEIEAAVEGANAVFVASDSSEELGSALVEMAARDAMWAERRSAIAAECRDRYSVEAMVAAMARLIRG